MVLWVLVFLFLLQAIGHGNPFDRRIMPKPYSVHRGLSSHSIDREISFKDRTRERSRIYTLEAASILETAIYDAMYQIDFDLGSNYGTPSIYFNNFVMSKHISHCFQPFHFSTISFCDVDPIEFCCEDFTLLPCDKLVLPRRIAAVTLHNYLIPQIKEMQIPAAHFVPLVFHDQSPDTPYRSAPINVIVPNDLMYRYQTDPTWSSLKFEDDEGNIHPATFNGQPPIDPNEHHPHIWY